jgi:hypothetical protein
MCYEVEGRGEVNNLSRIFSRGFEKRRVLAEKTSQINPVSIWEEEKNLHFQHHTQYVTLFNNIHGVKRAARFP